MKEIIFLDNTHLNSGIKLPQISVEVKSINGSKCSWISVWSTGLSVAIKYEGSDRVLG